MAGPAKGHGGRPPKPIEEKRRLGNPGKRRLPKANLVALAPVHVLPATPDPASGEELVARILETPASAWISEPDRLALLPLLAEAWDERKRLLVNPVYTPAFVSRLGQLERNLTTWLSLLGLTPTDRSRLGVAEVKARSKLEEIRARRAELGRRGG